MEEGKYQEVVKMVENHNKMNELYIIMDDYFRELEKHHPQAYNNLMNEINKLCVKINIENKQELDKYIKHIHHKDMPSLWTVEQTSKVGKDIGIDFDKWDYNVFTFNYVMNMMRADYYSEFKKMFASSPLMKQTIVDSPNFYAHMAKAWLDDEDAPKDKFIKYITIISGEDV